MGKLKHTPGPWKAEEHRGFTIGDCTLGYQIWAKVRIAFTERQNVGAEIEGANARLIAAAPLFYDAAKLMLVRHDSAAKAANFNLCGCTECALFRRIVYDLENA